MAIILFMALAVGTAIVATGVVIGFGLFWLAERRQLAKQSQSPSNSFWSRSIVEWVAIVVGAACAGALMWMILRPQIGL
jgi:hypothetical protein